VSAVDKRGADALSQPLSIQLHDPTAPHHSAHNHALMNRSVVLGAVNTLFINRTQPKPASMSLKAEDPQVITI
jgi:hypothetical protein